MSSKLFLAALLCTAQLPAQVAVVNAATFRSEVAVGSWASAFGSFGAVTAGEAGVLPIPRVLRGVTVVVDGKESPVNYISSGQINFLIPYAATTGVRPVEVKIGALTLSGTANIVPLAPGIFPQNGDAPPKGAILNQDNSLNAQANPTKRGDVIQIFATGPGPLTTTPDDGTGAGSAPLIESKSKPEVYISGVPASIQFSGLTPGYAGLWQINAVVPNQAFITGKVSVVLFMNGVTSNEVYAFVQ
jgi:adhesin/invasin